jgi:hypothetical protein
VYSLDGPSESKSRKRKKGDGNESSTYRVTLTPVCYHAKPRNESELQQCISRVLKALNLLHQKGSIFNLFSLWADCMFY